jgi:hypothetical protein
MVASTRKNKASDVSPSKNAEKPAATVQSDSDDNESDDGEQSEYF